MTKIITKILRKYVKNYTIITKLNKGKKKF